MTELLVLSIGLGLAVALLFSERFGYAPGGLVVPGYLALYLVEPVYVAMTLGASLLTFFIVRAASTVLIIYGRRRTVLMILVGYILGALPGLVQGPMGLSGEARVIGYILPGLVAIWMDRQGIVETVSAMMIVAVIVRLIMVLTVGARMLAL